MVAAMGLRGLEVSWEGRAVWGTLGKLQRSLIGGSEVAGISPCVYPRCEHLTLRSTTFGQREHHFDSALPREE